MYGVRINVYSLGKFFIFLKYGKKWYLMRRFVMGLRLIYYVIYFGY